MKEQKQPCHPVFPGTEVPPPDPRYPALVRGFNQRFVGNPEYVQLCGGVEQVRHAVQHAVDDHRRITVRGGGHCYEGFVSYNDGGVIIDLSPMNAVYFDNEREMFCIEGGATLWNVYTELYREYGVTIPGGSCYSVGAGGHIIGGGYGLLSRLHGLTVDHLSAVEVVHVTKEKSAEIVTVGRDATTQREKDLFWAHRGGGGGNFGVVTKYWFKDPPAAPSEAYLTNLAWNWDDLTNDHFTQIVTNYGAFLHAHSGVDSPFNGMFALLHLTHKSAQQIVLTMQYVGDEPGLIDAFIEAVKPEDLDHVPQRFPVGYHHWAGQTTDTRKMPWLEVTQTLNGSGANQRGKYKSAYLIEPFPEDQIETMWHFLTDANYNNPQALVQVDSYGGRINAVAPGKTAVPQRSSIMKLQYQTYWTDPRDDPINLAWIRAFYEAMYGPAGPYPDGVVDGCYINYPDVDLVDWQYLYYKDDYPRLQRAKAEWDPHNTFNHQQSIELPDD